jgi:hypothetical protein
MPSVSPLIQTLGCTKVARWLRVGFSTIVCVQVWSRFAAGQSKTVAIGSGAKSQILLSLFGGPHQRVPCSAFGLASATKRVQPNHSLKGRSNGGSPGPEPRYGVHFLFSGPGVPPSASPSPRTSRISDCFLTKSYIEVPGPCVVSPETPGLAQTLGSTDTPLARPADLASSIMAHEHGSKATRGHAGQLPQLEDLRSPDGRTPKQHRLAPPQK